jgi:hypothetical protein
MRVMDTQNMFLNRHTERLISIRDIRYHTANISAPPSLVVFFPVFLSKLEILLHTLGGSGGYG